jgi:N-acetyl-anhydromuramyl-L-alanine amidase AmpD
VTPPLPPLVFGPETTLHSPRLGEIALIVIHSISEEIWWPEEKSGELDRYVPADEWLTKAIPGRKPVSAHRLITPDGVIQILCEDVRAAWHAGLSEWRGQRNVNRISLGVELAVRGQHDYASFLRAIATDCYTSLQYRSLGWLCYTWMKRWKIELPFGISGHEHISGDDVRGKGKGKRDPGSGFNWQRLWDEIARWNGQMI